MACMTAIVRLKSCAASCSSRTRASSPKPVPRSSARRPVPRSSARRPVPDDQCRRPMPWEEHTDASGLAWCDEGGWRWNCWSGRIWDSRGGWKLVRGGPCWIYMESHSCLAGPNYRYRVISAQEVELLAERVGVALDVWQGKRQRQEQVQRQENKRTQLMLGS